MPDVVTVLKQHRAKFAAIDEELRPSLTTELERRVAERNKMRAAEFKVIEDALGMHQRRVLAPEDQFTTATRFRLGLRRRRWR